MNAIFLIFCILSLILTAIFSPNSVLPTMLGGIEKAFKLSITLISVYSLWSGVLKVAELSGATKKAAGLLKPAVRFLFGNVSEKSAEYISLNLSANILGLGGAATPYGINACKLLEQENNYFGAQTLLVLAATSVQILPTSVIALMASFGAKNPSAIILPAFLSSAISTICAVVLLKIFKPKTSASNASAKNAKTKLHATKKALKAN